MKFSLALIAFAVSAASAHDCSTGLKYCAYNLIGKGDYHSDVVSAMKNFYSTSDLKYRNADYALFRCDGPNTIVQVKDCNGYCSNGGDDKSDYCDN